MSQLLIKQKVFSWTDTYNIYDATGEPKYFVKADLFTFGHTIRVFNKATGREIGVIQEKFFRILKEFEISINRKPQGMIKKRFALFHPEYDIDYKGWRLEGDFLQWNYIIYEKSRCVVQISKKLFRWGDTYVLDIKNDEDEIPALMVAIAMDAANRADGNNNNS